jgi:DNA-binding FadR family transcriptional regulator
MGGLLMGVDKATDLVFSPVVGTRISAAIVNQIRTMIRSGQLPIGSRLPAERELCQQFGVSRLTVREALRMLEATGLVTIRLGKDGGAFVSAPTAGLVGEGFADLLATSIIEPAEMTEARVAVELAFLPLACERATPEDIAELEAMCDLHEAERLAGNYSVEMSFDFHLRLAACSHNAAIVPLLLAFRDPIIHSLQQARHSGTSGVAEHRAVVTAVAARDAALARDLLASHLNRTVDRLGTTS